MVVIARVEITEFPNLFPHKRWFGRHISTLFLKMMAGRTNEWELGAQRLFAHTVCPRIHSLLKSTSQAVSTLTTAVKRCIANVVDQARSPRTPELLSCSSIRLPLNKHVPHVDRTCQCSARCRNLNVVSGSMLTCSPFSMSLMYSLLTISPLRH
jgi:hypothetical protein